MKRTFLATVLSIVFAMVAVACHSSDEKEIGYAELPVQAQQFVKQYFPSATYSHVEKEKDHGKWEYEVLLTEPKLISTIRENGKAWTANTPHCLPASSRMLSLPILHSAILRSNHIR